MSTGEIYHLASIICYALSALVFALAVFLFFRFKIIDAFNVLSGRKLRQDLDRLKDLAGAASEGGNDFPPQDEEPPGKKRHGKAKGRVQKAATGDGDTEDLYRQSYGTEGGSETEEISSHGSSVSDTEELSKSAEPTGNSGDTEELDVVFTEASDTELL